MNSTLEKGRVVTMSSGEPTEAEREVLRAIRAVRYGAVEVVIHESRIVQVERTEKVRLLSEVSEAGGNRKEVTDK